MVCIYCHGDLAVSNSRPQKWNNQTWRRRLCEACGAMFTSIETVDLSQAISVSKHGKLQPFDRDRLFISMYESLRHRPSAISDARELSTTVTVQITLNIFEDDNRGQIGVKTIQALVLEILQRFDPAAATHYAAFHP